MAGFFSPEAMRSAASHEDEEDPTAGSPRVLRKTGFRPGVASINSRSLFFRPLHDEPRWQMFLEKYGISAEQLADLNFRVKLPN